MTSTIKVNTIQNTCGADIIKESSNTITIGASGDTVTLASGASQTGFGRTGTVDWNTTPKTATFSAVSGEGYFANTSGGAFTMNLPAGSAGAIVSVADYKSTFQTNVLTIAPNGSDKIGGENIPVALGTEGQSVTLVFVDSTEGWVTTADSGENLIGSPYITATGGSITTVGDYKIHTFTGPGTFAVSAAGAAQPPCTPACTTNEGGDGTPSVAIGITSTGGGGGGRFRGAGRAGGSGGGGGGRNTAAGGAGNTPPVSPAQGTNGGNARADDSPSQNDAGGGGGGAGSAGSPGGTVPSPVGGVGGNGVTTNISNSPVTLAGGGGGGGQPPEASGASGGPGGGGNADSNGSTNTGGGGGGRNQPPGVNYQVGKSGGSGIVIIRYKFQN